jgi:hypothetical protein
MVKLWRITATESARSLAIGIMAGTICAAIPAVVFAQAAAGAMPNLAYPPWLVPLISGALGCCGGACSTFIANAKRDARADETKRNGDETKRDLAELIKIVVGLSQENVIAKQQLVDYHENELRHPSVDRALCEKQHKHDDEATAQWRTETSTALSEIRSELNHLSRRISTPEGGS